MATKLEKNLTREASVKADDREILITITADQKVSMKLKGLRTGEVSISIEDLWHQLNGTNLEEKESTSKKSGGVSITHKAPKVSKNNPMISLHDIRTYNAISGLDCPTLVKFEGILKNLIDNYPEKYGKYSKP